MFTASCVFISERGTQGEGGEIIEEVKHREIWWSGGVRGGKLQQDKQSETERR